MAFGELMVMLSRGMTRRLIVGAVAVALGCAILLGAGTATTLPSVGLTGEAGTKGEPTRVKTLRIDKGGVYENYLVDAEFAETDAVQIKADHVTLRNCEIRNGMKDAIEVYASDVTIESCKIHHFLAGTFKQQKDAHGITGRPTKLTVRNCEIGFVSGDCLQFDPGRGKWDEVVIENCVLFADKLGEDAGGFKKGERPGENAVDTKQSGKNPRSGMVIRNCILKGFAKGGQIDNCAALNLKENVKVAVENCEFRDNEICLRLRGPGKNGGAHVTATDCRMFDSDVGIRAEDGLEGASIVRPRFEKVEVKVKEAGKKSGVKLTDEVKD